MNFSINKNWFGNNQENQRKFIAKYDEVNMIFFITNSNFEKHKPSDLIKIYIWKNIK